MMDDPERTEFAQQAYDFADLFAYRFNRQPYGRNRVRRLRLTEPDGPSTAGGRQARQPMLLVPDRGDGNLVLGWIDTTQRLAEIRTYDALKEQFKARFSMPIDLERTAYDQLRQDIDSFLRIQKIDVRVTAALPKAESDPADSVTFPWLLVGVLLAGIMIGLGLGYALFRG